MSKIIPKTTLEQIRDANDIVEVLGTYLQLKRAGSSYKALCPFHKEKTPSFHVNPQRQIFHCFGCGAGGDVFKFVMQYENVDFSTAARMLAQRGGIRVEWTDGDGAAQENKDALYRIHEDVAMLYHRALLESPSAEAARKYIQSRDISVQTAKDYLIGYAPGVRNGLVQWARKKKIPEALLEGAGLIMRSEEHPEYSDRFRNRLMFSIRDEIGRVVAFSGRSLDPDAKTAKYVNSPETALFRKSRVLYGLDRARREIADTHTAVLCEGQIDVIRCHIAGVQNAVAAQGTALTEEHARLLKRFADSVIVVLDADRAGQDAALRSADVLTAAGFSVRIAALPKGEDPDSLVRKQGGDALRSLLDRAQSALRFHVDVLRSREDLGSEASLMRAAGVILDMIARAPSEVQRDQMLRQAAHELGVGERALRADLQRKLKRGTRPSPVELAAGSQAPVAHPPEEIALAELLAHHEDLAPLVDAHLPMEHLTDPACRRIISLLIRQTVEPDLHLMTTLAAEDEEWQRLAAQIQMAPRKVCGPDVPPRHAAQDLILRIWRRVLDRKRTELRQRMATAEGAERERLSYECTQITLDIKALQQGWDKALHVLECSQE
ncbi:MAG: DNA primase [Verrucomicrobia bacterium ADurb.Bin345]|nr:MAG: DNA primase [Verrucomicrobia bacterium ADurb.Bin345]